MNRKKTQSIIEHVLYEFLGNGNLSRYDQFVEKDVKVHHSPSGKEIGLSSLFGRENVKIIDKHYSEAFKIKKVQPTSL